jgi:ABC-type nitrate/sulfonate/bicarbonate transport system substrate-binding protein
VRAATGDELRFRVGYPDLPSTLLIYVAQDQRLFDAEHLRVESKVFATGREALPGELAGELDARGGLLDPAGARGHAAARTWWCSAPCTARTVSPASR